MCGFANKYTSVMRVEVFVILYQSNRVAVWGRLFAPSLLVVSLLLLLTSRDIFRFSACQGVAGITSTQNGSCKGWKSCYESAGAISIKDGSCLEAHACAEIKGNVTTIR